MSGVKLLLGVGGVGGLIMYYFLFPVWYVPVISLLSLFVAYLIPSPYTKIDPNGKAVFITGCDSGFGWNLAKQLDSLGFQVFASCLFPESNGACDLKKECSANLHVIKMDVTDDTQVEEALVYVRNHLVDTELWAVVNNAGVSGLCEVEWCPLSDYEHMWRVNTLGMVRVSKAFLPDLRKVKGRIVNVASLASRYTLTAFSAYSMSKHAAISFTDGLRREMIKFGVKVCLVEPSLYDTAIAQVPALLKTCSNNWNASSDEVKAAYGEEYFDAFKETIPRSLAKMMRKDISEVVDKLVHSVLATDPKERYVSPLYSRIRVNILSSLPYSMVDNAMAKILSPTHPVSFKAKVE